MRPTRWLCALALALPVISLAQSPGTPLVGTLHAIHVGPGDQSDPHVSGTHVAYTHRDGGPSQIRFHELLSGADAGIPNDGASDSLSDIWGTQIVFTRQTAEASALYRFDVSAGGPAVEVAPTPGANRRGAAIGGGTIAWMDFGVAGGNPEILLLESGASAPTRLTWDDAVDRDPAVSPDGSVVVWVRCELSGTCALMEAVAGPGGWAVQSLGEVEATALPDTNGVWIVYAARRGEPDADLYWQPVGGGLERRLPLEGVQHNPNVSGTFIAFEHAEPGGLNSDVLLYDTAAEWLYRLTDTPEGESLNDLSVGDTGEIRVVWSVPGAEGLDVLGMSLQPPEAPCTTQPTSCEDPGERPLLIDLEVGKRCGHETRTKTFEALAGDGLLCIDNGRKGKRASSGWVKLNGEKVVRPNDFGQHVERIERAVALEEGRNTLSASVKSHPKSDVRVRLYGAAPACAPQETFDGERRRGRFGPVEMLDGRPLTPVSPNDPSGTGAMGCNASGTSQVGATMLLIILALIVTNGPGQRERVRVRFGRRRR